MDITQVLMNAQSPDINVRTEAEQHIAQAKATNFPMFMLTLGGELCNEQKAADVRRLAGLIMKNSLDSKDEALQEQINQQWLQLPADGRSQVKNTVLQALASPVKEARHTAAQTVAKIAAIELPAGEWLELIDGLLQNVTASGNDFLKQSTLETLGYVCEEIEPSVLQAKSNQILTAVIQGMAKTETNPEVKRAAATALLNALEFVKENFENEVERNYIMQTVCETTQCAEKEIKVAAYECIVKVSSLYYDKLAPYMQALFTITFDAVKKEEDEVAQQAVEFWSTVCDEEIELNDEALEAQETGTQPERASQNFVKGAMAYLVPLLTETLTRQEDEQDDDSWNVSMAAGTCLALVAQTTGDDVVPVVMPFIQQHITSDNWRFREASTLAFGSILEGPSNAALQPLVAQAIPIMITLMKDQNVQVKDTAAWTLGRICDLHSDSIQPKVLEELVQPGGVLLEGLKEEPRVAGNVCWALHNLSEACESEAERQTYILSPYFVEIAKSLLGATERDDCTENNLRSSAYEALNTLLANAAMDTYPMIEKVVPVLLERLEKTFTMQIVSADDKEEQSEIQGHICGTLQVIVQKLGARMSPFADKMMGLFLQVFGSKAATVHEEALMAVGAVANAVEKEFEKYMPHFRPYLQLGLKNCDEHQVCAVAVGVVGDICRALEVKILPYCDEIVTLLLQNLQNPNLNRNVKPPILSCFGDIALAISGQFEKYLVVTMTMLQQASQTQVDMENYDLVDYLNQLREGIFEAYTGILQGLRAENKGDLFVPFVDGVMQFLQTIANDNRDDAVTRCAVGVIGDMAHTLNAKVRNHMHHDFVKTLIKEAKKSPSHQTKEVAQWAQQTLKQLG